MAKRFRSPQLDFENDDPKNISDTVELLKSLEGSDNLNISSDKSGIKLDAPTRELLEQFLGSQYLLGDSEDYDDEEGNKRNAYTDALEQIEEYDETEDAARQKDSDILDSMSEDEVNDLNNKPPSQIRTALDNKSKDVDVVDTTNGIQPDEEETLFQALSSMTPEARDKLFTRFNVGTDPGEFEPERASEELKAGTGIKSGNALAKLIGSLKF